MHPLYSLQFLPWVLGVLILCGIFFILTLISIFIVKKTVSDSDLRSHQEVAGFVFTNIGVLYAVLLGFTVVNAQQRFDKIKDTIQLEASYLGELYRDAEVFSEDDRNNIQRSLKKYTESIINEEWDSMSIGLPHSETVLALNDIWGTYYALNPVTAKEQAWYKESINKLNQLFTARIARLQGSQESLGVEMWSLLLFGGIILATFICFFSLNASSHMLLAFMLSATISFLLFLIYSFDTAYIGDINIPPGAFIRALEGFQRES